MYILHIYIYTFRHISLAVSSPFEVTSLGFHHWILVHLEPLVAPRWLWGCGAVIFILRLNPPINHGHVDEISRDRLVGNNFNFF